MPRTPETLKTICEEILNCGDDLGRQFAACDDLYDFYVGLTGISILSKDDDDNHFSMLKSGKAIAPREAAFCIPEFQRTTQFLRGTYAAIRELQNRFPDERLDVIYAGSGPFGTLLTTLLPLFSARDLTITFLDCHLRSLESVASVLDELGFTAFASDFVETDAAEYVHVMAPHLVVSETMQTALKREPQVAITLNLAPQLIENGIFVPQNITIEACLTDLDEETFSVEAPAQRIYFGRIFSLDTEKIKVQKTDFAAVNVEVPPFDSDKLSFCLMTQVFVFGDYVLREKESSITDSWPVPDFQDFTTGERFCFRYICDGDPHFEIVKLTETAPAVGKKVS